MSSSALILGSSGLVGSHLLARLLESPHVGEVRALVRRPTDRRHPKLREVIIDYDRMEAARDHIRGDDVFCCLGTTIRAAGSQEAFRKVDFHYVVDAAIAAHRNGASRCFIVSSIGASVSSSSFYLRVKGEMEAAVAKVPFASVGLLRPSLLLGERREVRLGERLGAVGMRALSFAMIGPARKYRPIAASDVAAGMLFLSRTNFTGVRIAESDEIQAMADVAHKELRP